MATIPISPRFLTQAVAWSSDGRVVTTGGSLDVPGRTEGRIRRFDAASGRVLADLAVKDAAGFKALVDAAVAKIKDVPGALLPTHAAA